MASAIIVSLPLFRSYFAHRYSILASYFWEPPFGFMQKEKPALMREDIKTGILWGKIVLWILSYSNQNASKIILFFPMSKIFFIFFSKKTFWLIFKNEIYALHLGELFPYSSESVVFTETTKQDAIISPAFRGDQTRKRAWRSIRWNHRNDTLANLNVAQSFLNGG